MEKEKLYHIALDDYEHGVVIRSLCQSKRFLCLGEHKKTKKH